LSTKLSKDEKSLKMRKR